MTKPTSESLAAELCVELHNVISHMSAKRNYLSPDNAHIVPQALLTTLGAVIALNFSRSGHATLVKLSADRLKTVVEDADRAAQKLTPEQRRSVNPMEPCGCGGKDAGEMTDDEIGAALSRAVAEALGLDLDQVKAVKLDGKEADAVAKSDDPDEMAKVAKEVQDKLAEILRGPTKH